MTSRFTMHRKWRPQQLKLDFHSCVSLVTDEIFAKKKCSNMVYSPQNRATNICLGKATITRCDLSARFFCIDAKLLCEFESDKI